MDDDYERIILVKPEIFVYRIPPRTSNRGFRAAEWKLDAPDWSGRLRIVSKGNNCVIKLEDKISGELYAACPVDSHPGSAVESVIDSARYFVLRIKDENGRAANIGMGFVDRADSFDFNVALQDHFKHLKQSQEAKNAPLIDDSKKLDLSFKEGQTITINIGKKSETSTTRQKPKTTLNSSGGFALLPPPPGSKSTGNDGSKSMQNTNPFINNPSTATKPQNANQQTNIDLLIDIEDSSHSTSNSNSSTSQKQSSLLTNPNWMDF